MVKIIAEFCQNHNGDYHLLQEMIHQAAESGAVYGKMQTIFADDLTFRERFEQGVEQDGVIKVIKRPYQAEYARLKGLEIGYEQQAQFIEDCNRYGLIPMTTCFTRGAVEPLSQLKWGAIKVASYDCGAAPLLKGLATEFKHIIVSTGASYDEEIKGAAAILKVFGSDYAFLHCVTIYPTPLCEMHLNRMLFLKQFASDVGLSSHPLTARDGIKADLVAVYLGAEYIERHFTILSADQTRDGPVSIVPHHLKEMVRFSMMSKPDQKLYLDTEVPDLDIMMGKATRDLSHAELLNRDYYRGRFATHVSGRVIYNWEDVEPENDCMNEQTDGRCRI
ncbi:MAG: N-acetylneuraminate synthase family protein [Deltaproteobacteria bacterium]|nr:N-acetylneuraminate synthase family protein [Deltaproteobacteria bacterium]